MALSIKDPNADKLARELAAMCGESITEAVLNSLQERLEKKKRSKTASSKGLYEDIMAIGRHCASLPVKDARSPDEILGYDENGMPR